MDVLVINLPNWGREKETECEIDFDKMDYSPVGILENANLFKNFNRHLAFEACGRAAECINLHNRIIKKSGHKATFRIGATYNQNGFKLSAIINTLSGPFIYKENMSHGQVLKYIQPIKDLIDSIVMELEILYPFSGFGEQSIVIDKKGGIVINLVDMVDLSHIPEQYISCFNDKVQ